jgi:methionyl-tRNA formyltransferase
MEKIKLTFFGSPDFAAYFLEKLLTDTTINQLIEVKLIVTQKDKLVGRKQILTPTSVKQVALKHGLEILEIKSRLGREKISQADIALVYAYGDLIPKDFLDLPKYGFWNIHPSLLPKYRGPMPIAAPLIKGDKTTGVTIIKMDEQIDHGPIIAQESLTIEKNDKRPDLEKKLTDLGFEMFKSILLSFPQKRESMTYGSVPAKAGIRSGMTPTPQHHELATYTKKLSKQDGFIEFSKLKDQISNNSEELFNLYRGLYKWPGIWTTLPNGKRLKITDIDFVENKLIIRKVQLESKNEVSFETFNKAYNIF